MLQFVRGGGITFNIFYFEVNQGHGNARRKSLELCSNEYVALMDADDVSICNRFDLQLKEFASDKSLDICGGNISEFIGEETNVVSFRKVPEDNLKIRKYAKSRCPMNQMTVIFKKDIYDKAGGYIDWYQDEDYYLWLRMMKIGAKFKNIDFVLVNARIGSDMYMRRGGAKYYKSERKLQKYMLEEHFISIPKFIINCLKRFIVQVLLPNKVRGWVFKKFARS